MARSNRDILCLDKGKINWWEGGGRPEGSISTTESSRIARRVKNWIENHPNNHNKSECARDLRLTRPTVRKWWKLIEEERLNSVTRRYQKTLSAEEMMSAMTNPDDPNYLELMHF